MDSIVNCSDSNPEQWHWPQRPMWPGICNGNVIWSLQHALKAKTVVWRGLNPWLMLARQLSGSTGWIEGVNEGYQGNNFPTNSWSYLDTDSIALDPLSNYNSIWGLCICRKDSICIKWDSPHHKVVMEKPCIHCQRSVAVQDVVCGGCEAQDGLMGEMCVWLSGLYFRGVMHNVATEILG